MLCLGLSTESGASEKENFSLCFWFLSGSREVYNDLNVFSSFN